MTQPPLKILHVVFSLEAGGLENGLVNVANLLPPDRFEIHVACLERRGEFAERLRDPSRVVVLNKPPGLAPRASVRLARLIREIRPNLLHTHNLGPLIYTFLARPLSGLIPILHGEHAMLSATETSSPHLWMRRLLYTSCRRIHTVSTSLTQHLVDHGFNARKIESVINGVDTARFAPASQAGARKTFGLPEISLVLGMVGSLQRRKHHREALAAFNRIASEFPTAHLLIAGGRGPETDLIQQEASNSPAADRIHLVGLQNDPRACYQSMDLLLVPSVNEGLSNATLEAMSCGVPVLANSTCGSRDVIEDGKDGWVRDITTAENFAQTLRGIIAHPDALLAMRPKARAKVDAEFPLARMAAHYARLYEELAR